ncbi:MAG: tetratricopeptide repeat protein [Verrucomicrobia bacterium]|nr:tetratricopeptide repeat protein [Verrucomicrobiota bacterium]
MTDSTAVPGITQRHSFALLLGVAAGLVCLTILAFFGVWNNGFINYDDNTYVFLNPDVVRGLDWQTVEWAFGHVDACHWVPLTWLSYALDCQMFGLNPAGCHTTNLILHSASVVLLFFVLQSLTSFIWRNALVAALFGTHPLRVESVAWIAERKDVLSGFFFMLSLLAYVRFARSAQVTGQRCVSSNQPSDLQTMEAGLRFPSSRFYWLAVFFFACGLLSKPMLVTMPFVLLLLDAWPLKRIELSISNFQFPTLKQLVLEKIPFIVLSGIISIVTYLAQEAAKSAWSTSTAGLSPLPRLANALHATATYLWQQFWPTNLAVYYPPQPFTLFSPIVLTSASVLLVVTIVAVFLWRSRPHFTMGWFWFLGVLLPVSGLVQSGDMIQADRFTYLPSIGLFILIVWSLAEFASRPVAKIGFRLVAVAALCLFAVKSHRQVGLWKDTRTLFTHTARVTHNNHVALAFLADFELTEGRLSQAEATTKQVLKILPGYPRAEYLMASILQMQGRMQEAIPYLEQCIGSEVAVPGRARMILSLIDAGRFAEADTILYQLWQVASGDPNLALMKAALLRNQGQSNEAKELFRKVVAAQTPPLADNPTMNFEIAELFWAVGDAPKASPFYAKAIEQSPRHVNALNNYSWLLATEANAQQRNGARAVELAERACKATEWKQPVFMGTLAAAYAEAGRFDDAAKMAARAHDMAKANGMEGVAKRNEELMELYRQGKPYREPAQ